MSQRITVATRQSRRPQCANFRFFNNKSSEFSRVIPLIIPILGLRSRLCGANFPEGIL
ncbi:hypothetical protein LY78DRAFT_657296 [Colletotrichum sublineola]|nr:hypothetical protein LY78DRAFT_657296 [Colletotrichum sublineola]